MSGTEPKQSSTTERTPAEINRPTTVQTKPIPTKRKTITNPLKPDSKNVMVNQSSSVSQIQTESKCEKKTNGKYSKAVNRSSKRLPNSVNNQPGMTQTNPFYDGVIYLHNPKEDVKCVMDNAVRSENYRLTTTAFTPESPQQSGNEKKLLYGSVIEEAKSKFDQENLSNTQERKHHSNLAQSYEREQPKEKATSEKVSNTPPKPSPRRARPSTESNLSFTASVNTDPDKAVNKTENPQPATTQSQHGNGNDDVSQETEVGLDSSRPTEETRQYDTLPKTRKPPARAMAVDVSLYDKPRPPRKVVHQEHSKDVMTVVDVNKDKTPREQMQSADKMLTSLDTVIVDKRYYDYMSQFRKEDIEPMQKVCDIEIKPVFDARSNDVQLRFIATRAGSIGEWQQRFIELYEHLKEELVIERVDIQEIDNARRYREDIERRYRCLFHTVGRAVEIICERRALDGIQCVTKNYMMKTTKSQSALPTGYDIAGVFYVYLYTADISRLNVDVLAITTNDKLQHEFGVAKAVAEAAGFKLVQMCVEHVQKTTIQMSDVVRTTAGNLPCKAVLHAVEPRWPYCDDENAQNICRIQLMQMFENVLVAAEKEHCRSIAICPVNSEQDNPPADVIAKVIKDTLLHFSLKRKRPKLRQVHIVDTADSVQTLITNEIGDAARIRTNSGEYVAVAVLPRAMMERITADNTGKRMEIDENNVTSYRASRNRTKSIKGFLCGSNKHK